ncbi:MAG: hypothetical protein J6Y94_02785, partial [Bacteriovoracaceae bacterium]|nr:hypothetical protein [Bacteriovoracaceae bacterium]
MQKIRGQITVFLAITLIGVMSMLAFVVNVGLFVKAKINLQNAVDAAAWAGAAVQARQMTTLAYLNWEMRNVYKECMFKFYVLGQFSLTDTRLDTSYALSPEQNGHAGMSFRMRQFYPRGHSHHNPKSFDPYNVPSLCLHFGNDKSAKNICELYDVPGIPRFETVGIPGISELHETLVNNITKVKMNDCSRRSNYNFATAMIYAYGNGHVFSQDTLVASNRPGAWPSAFELAVRARNVEAFVNRRPIEEGICTFDSSCKNPADLDNENTPVNERPIKAYWSAFRNLNKEMQANFKLTELPPQPYHPQGLSAFLIPEEAAYDGNKFADNKYYIDLQMYPLNLVTFFTSFVSQAGTFEEVASEAECRGTRVGIPMPAYLFGFVKNPEVLTYYAVKGETRFTGLLFPFLDKRGIKLEAYAAAKPFGGRIGPMLFSVTGDAKTKL